MREPLQIIWNACKSIILESNNVFWRFFTGVFCLISLSLIILCMPIVLTIDWAIAKIRRESFL